MALVDTTGPIAEGYQGTAHILPDPTNGKGIVIGDGYWLTAGHVIYEWDRVSGISPSIIANPSLTGLIYDYRQYRAAYQSAVIAEVNSHPVPNPSDSKYIEGSVTAKDSVVLSGQS